MAEPDFFEQGGGFGAGGGGRMAEDFDGADGDVLERGEMREEVEALEHHADAGAHAGQFAIAHVDAALPVKALADQLAVDEDVAGVRDAPAS